MNELYLLRRFEKRLRKLTLLPAEINGCLIYLPINNKDFIVYSRILGSNSSDVNTEANPQRLYITQEFLKENPEYGFVEFHTHTKNTIKKYGEYHAKNLSANDIEAILKNYCSNDIYRHLLVTPQVLKLHKINGKSIIPISFSLIEDIELQQELEDSVNIKFIELENRLGIHLGDILIK